jgi:hypothetical protein
MIIPSALRGSYRIAHFLPEVSEHTSAGEFGRKCLQHVMQEICPEKETVFHTVSLSRATMTQRVENISTDLLKQLRNKANAFERFCLALHESNFTSETAQLLIASQGVTVRRSQN